MVENFPSLMKDINLQIQEAEQTASWKKPKISMYKYIIFKLKEKSLENN